MLIESWRILSNVDCSEDERELSMWEFYHFLSTTRQYSFWRSKISLMLDLSEPTDFDDFVKDCFYLKIYQKRIKKSQRKPLKTLPTIDELQSDFDSHRNRSGLILFTEVKIFKYIRIMLYNHATNLYNKQNGVSDNYERLNDDVQGEILYELDKFSFDNNQIEQSIYSNPLFHDENIDFTSLLENDEELRNNIEIQDSAEKVIKEIKIKEEELKHFYFTIKNLLGSGIAKKTIQYFQNHNFCFWLIKRVYDFADERDLFQSLRNHYPIYQHNPNLSQNLTRCRKSFEKHVYSTRNGL